ncbi:MAG TPA: CPBP family intramembrane glutamic endopeptidase [Candidatus Limnocylindrales bacterium]|nr:CPBP family intramembrane glutamic endopeptidase [Candidatus Limnocylindrales bacterium]
MTAARRGLPTDPADLLRSIVPLALVGLAAIEPAFRLVVVGLVGVGAAVAVSRRAPVRWAWAAAVPVALSLFWGTLPAPAAAAGLGDCADPASPVATWRALEAVVVLLALAAAAVVLKATTGSLWLRWPARRWIGWAALGFVVTGPVALLIGPFLARPFFGDVGYTLALGAIAPALVFAVANGVMEELIYRGALLGWSAKVMGLGPALVGQAVVFGLAHSGTDVVGLQLPLMLAMGLGGLLAGLIAVRTGSLLIPIAIHIGLDIPIYFALACGG